MWRCLSFRSSTECSNSGSGEFGLLPGAVRGGRHGVYWLLQVAGWRTWCVGVPSALWSSLLLRGEGSRCVSALVCTRLVFLVTLQLALCSCVFVWPTMLRTMAGSYQKDIYAVAGFAGDSAYRAVLLSLSSGPRCSVSWSACPPLGVHHGRYGPEEQ